MVVHVARTAAAHGAHIATRVKVTGFRRPGEVEAVDEETGEPLLLRARHVAGAAGVWTDRLRELAGGVSRHRIVPSKGIHIFVARDRLPMDTGVLARTEKSVLFVIPWQGGWLIGDTDTPWRHGPDSPVATGADVDYLLAKTNALLAEPLTRDDVHGVIVGLRPLVADAARSDTTRISRKHVVESPAPGLTTIAGGKYTTYRVMAADLIDAVAPGTRSVTRDVPLVDRDLDGVDEVTYACTHEGALHLDDVLERRTRLALTAPDRGLAAAEPAAAVMADALGWSPERTRQEVDAYRARVAAARAAEAERDDDVGARRPPRRARRAPRGERVTLVAGLDQGTSSTRCVVLDAELREVAAASVPVECSFPAPGLVEQDPEAIVASAREAIAATGVRPDVLGIANQTETFVVWDRGTGEAVHPAIVWQDRRTDDACAALREHAAWVRERTGLELDATFPATKLRWVLDHAGGDLAYGDVASWLLQRLAGVHVTDVCNAGRSLLCPLGGGDWDDELLDLFGIPRALMPPIVDSDALDAEIDGIPVRAAAGDQQASLFGLRCWEPGTAKVTLGTGAFVLAQAGTDGPASAGRHPRVDRLAARGRHQLRARGLHPDRRRRGRLVRAHRRPAARRTSSTRSWSTSRPGPVCVPAFQGFGSPTWHAAARGALLGLELGTTRADLARAVIDGIVHQVADAVEAIGTLDTLRIDGGLSRSDWTAQRLADLAGVTVQRTARPDSTALGAATLAGLAAGVWDGLEAIPEIPFDLVAEPAIPARERDHERERWAQARALVSGS